MYLACEELKLGCCALAAYDQEAMDEAVGHRRPHQAHRRVPGEFLARQGVGQLVRLLSPAAQPLQLALHRQVVVCARLQAFHPVDEGVPK